MHSLGIICGQEYLRAVYSALMFGHISRDANKHENAFLSTIKKGVSLLTVPSFYKNSITCYHAKERIVASTS